MENIELVGLRYYGGEIPIALISIENEVRLFDIDGMTSLIKKYEKTNNYLILNEIKAKMLETGEYPDIQENDFSGQKKLF